jgi:hypothetical protein
MINLLIPRNVNMGCTLRYWIENKLVNTERFESEDNIIWINGKNNILFWNADELYNAKGICINNINCNHKITMNYIIPGTLPSFYWSRDERQLNIYMSENPPLPYNERPQNTIFLGSIKDKYQGSFRKKTDWRLYIDEFDCPNWNHDDNNYKYTQMEYYAALSRSKYGLCLRGGGPKCWRDIEYLALGTVLLVTDGVDTDGYHNPLIENVHYIKIGDATEIKQKIGAITEEKWTHMSQSCIEWYKNNCGFTGSLSVIEKIVSKL